MKIAYLGIVTNPVQHVFVGKTKDSAIDQIYEEYVLPHSGKEPSDDVVNAVKNYFDLNPNQHFSILEVVIEE